MQLVPLQAVPNQLIDITVGSQPMVVKVYQKLYGLFFDLAFQNGSTVIAGVLCQNLNRLVRYKYLGFTGDFIFADAVGDADPGWTGLGGRFELLYLTADDLDVLGLDA